jgi:hypothetical protein
MVEFKQSQYPQFEQKMILDSNYQPITGELFFDNTTYRVKNGLLDGGEEPAIELMTGYVEYFENGIFKVAMQA